MLPPAPPKEIADLMKFIAKKSKNVNSPMNILALARQYREESGTTLTVKGVQSRISTYRTKIHEMNEFDVDTKVKMIFALAAPVDDGFLIELKKMADVVVDDLKRIIQYKKKGGGLELNWKSFPEECCRKMLEFLEEKSKTVNTPMMDQPFLREFKSATGDQSTLDSLRQRYERVKKMIYKSSNFNKNTKIKMMFISNAKITGNILNELRKCARVEIDERGRIKKYEANDGSLNLKGVHGSSNANKCLSFDRWQAICQKAINDDSADDEEGSNGDKQVENEYINMIRYVMERTKDANAPLNIKMLARDFKKESGSLERWRCIRRRIESFRQRICDMDMFDTSMKVRCVFALSATISDDVRKKLQKDSIVELDEKRRIKKYEAKDGSLILERKHRRDAKMREKTEDFKDSSDSEEEEDNSDDEESEEEGDENLSDYGGDYDDDLPSYHQYDDGNQEENESPEKENDADISSMVPEPISVVGHGADHDSSTSQLNEERIQEEDSEQVSTETELQGPLEDQNAALMTSQIVIYDPSTSPQNEEIFEEEDSEEVPMEQDPRRATGTENLVEDNVPTVAGNASDALITVQIVEQIAESATSSQEKSNDSHDGEDDNDYDLPSYNQYDEMNHDGDDAILSESGKSGCQQDSSSSETNEKIERNPVNMTASESTTSISSSEKNSGDESPEKVDGEVSMKRKDLPRMDTEPINFVGHELGCALSTSQPNQERNQADDWEPRSKRSRMLDSVPEESKEELSKPATTVKEVLFLLRATLVAIGSTQLDGVLMKIDSIIEKLDNGGLKVTLDDINDPFECSFFPLIRNSMPKGPTKEETTSFHDFLVSLKTVTLLISHPTAHLLRRTLKDVIEEFGVEDKRILVNSIGSAMSRAIDLITKSATLMSHNFPE